MKKLALVIAGLVIVAALSLSVLVGGCGSGGDAAPDQAQNEPDEVCPDTLLKGDSYILSSEMDGSGQPLGNQNVFTPETEKIYVTFYLSQDI